MPSSKIRTLRSIDAGDTIRVGNVVLTPDEPRIEIDGRPLYLCRQELALLQLLATKKGTVVNAGTISKRMSRGGRPLTATGVAVYVHRLRARLKYGGVVIRTLRGFGYLLEAANNRLPK